VAVSDVGEPRSGAPNDHPGNTPTGSAVSREEMFWIGNQGGMVVGYRAWSAATWSVRHH
jgi:hypothetical protein